MSNSVTTQDRDELLRLLEKANMPHPKESDIINLRAYLAAHPERWSRLTNVATAARDKTLESLGNPAVAELTRASMKELIKKLDYDTASAVERLLIDHITLAWVNFHYVLYQYNAVTNGNGITLTLGAYWEKRLSAAQGRYLRALETLAKVRKLSLNLIHVNISRSSSSANELLL